MKWQRGYRSSDVDDRRGAGMGLSSGLFGPLVAIGSRFGIVGLVAAVALYFAARAFLSADTPMSATSPSTAARPAVTSGQDDVMSFVSFVFDDAQKTWEEKFAERGRRYDHAKLVVFEDRTTSGCGYGSATVGPFYCPADQRVYIDLSFYRELARRFGAPGDFAAGLCHCARSGTSRAGIARKWIAEHGASPQEPRSALGGVGQIRAAGGLLGGRLGQLDGAARPARARRHRRGARRRIGHRRRPLAAAIHRDGESRDLHARLVRSTRALVSPRSDVRQYRCVRHVLGHAALTIRGALNAPCVIAAPSVRGCIRCRSEAAELFQVPA